MSELFLSLQEIRRRMQARIGFTTNGSQAPLTGDQHTEFIRAAAQEVYLRCPWSQAMRETRVNVAIDQRFVAYPANAQPGNIQSIGVWKEDEEQYCALRRARIPVTADDEPLVEEGEPASIDNRDTPAFYELKQQIEIWPRPDQVYELKIDHTISPDLANNADVSVVDAEAIILWAMADAYDFLGDARLADTARKKFEARIARLIGDQSPLTQIHRGCYDRLAVRGRRDDSYVPDSGLWPSRMPS